MILVIPCYNEAKTIGRIVFKAKKYVDSIIVIDDQSTDNTKSVAWESGASVYSTKGKHGAGVAIQEGIRQALKTNAEFIIFCDGDGQHDPDEIPKIYQGLKIADMVTLSRMHNKELMPKYRTFGIDCINLAYNFGNKRRIFDTQCGFRGFRREVLEQINVTENGFAYSTETLIKVRKLGFKILEINTNAIYHKEYSQNSSLNPIKHGLDVLLRTIYWRLKTEV